MRNLAQLPRKLSIPAHPRFRGFEAFAAREIFPRIADREAERRKLVGRAKMFGSAGALIVTALIVLAYFGEIRLVVMLAVAFVVIAIAVSAALRPVMSFASGLDDFLVAQSCKFLKLRHTGAEAKLSIERFVSAKVSPAHDRHEFMAGIECEDPDLAFSAAQTLLIEDQAELWRGLLMQVPAPHRFEGHTLVFPKQWAVDKRGMERIELGLGDLEEGLEIRTTHPAEARAVLTRRLMQRLADASERLGKERPSLALIADDVLLAVESDNYSFNPFHGGWVFRADLTVFKPIDLAERLDRITADIALRFALAEGLRNALGSRTGARSA